MPKLTVGETTGEVPADRRLVLAIEELGVRIGHRCGGNARCTTCRVRFADGEPSTMTRAEFDKLTERGLLGEWRLSCQILCAHDMHVEPGMTMDTEGWPDPGPPPAETVTPEPTWFSEDELRHGEE
jgi:ferredoxin